MLLAIIYWGYQMSNEWISVNDQLPHDFTEVMFFAVLKNEKEIMIGHRQGHIWYHCCLFYNSRALTDNVKVTHWMELPKYPRE